MFSKRTQQLPQLHFNAAKINLELNTLKADFAHYLLRSHLPNDIALSAWVNAISRKSIHETGGNSDGIIGEGSSGVFTKGSTFKTKHHIRRL